MRNSEARALKAPNGSEARNRTLRLLTVALGIGLVMTAGAARAEDDEDDKTFEEKIIDGLMSGIGATNMNNRGIDYRERSPLVVPPSLTLPPPENAKAEIKDPNWPKDPDEARRKKAIAERKKSAPSPLEAARPLSPNELNAQRATPTVRAESDPVAPGTSATNPMLSPTQLGFDGKFSNLFGGKAVETAPFKGEPTRDSLTQPPPGYQTPSPNFAYGTGPKDTMYKEYNPIQGKYGD
jgi:hypothetical protein